MERLRRFQQGLTTGNINLSAILGDNDTKPQDDSALGNNPAIGGKDKWLSPDRLEFYRQIITDINNFILDFLLFNSCIKCVCNHQCSHTSAMCMGEKYVNIPDSSEFQKLSGGNLVSSTHHLFNRR